MNAKKSSLNINTLEVLTFNCAFTFPKEKVSGEEVDEMFAKYSIDVDYYLKPLEAVHQVYLKILINHDGLLPGYKIDIFTVGVFSIEEEMNPNEISDFLQSSGLSIVISFVRTFLMTVTSNFPFGKYTLSSIDMIDLRVSKMAQFKSKQKPKAVAKRAKPDR
jgi:preprotein translocase subunit SecB